MLSSPTRVSIILLSLAATVFSQSRGALQQCWQDSVLTPSSGPHCVESDLKCICGSLNRNLNSLLDCVRDPNQVSRLPAHNIRQAIDSRLVSCSSSSNQNSIALSKQNRRNAVNAAKEQTLKPRSTPEKEEEVEGDILIKRVSTAAAPPASQATTALPSLPPLNAAAPTTALTALPTTSFMLNNGAGTETLIPTYTDTPPLIVSVAPTGTSSPTSKPTGGSGNNGGTLLDMSGAASKSAPGKKSLLGLTVFVLACVAWF